MAIVTYNTLPNPLWQFTDYAGKFLVDGYVKTWEDLARTTPKAVAQDPEGNAFWPNPFDLSSAGSQYNLFWADDSNYFIEVYSNEDILLYSFTVYSSGVGASEDPIKNYIVDGQFRFPYATSYVPITAGTFIAPKCFFSKNAVSTDNITIVDFPLGQTFIPEGNPVSYLNWECTVPNVAEIYKNIFQVFSDVNSFEGNEITISFYAKSSTAAQIFFRWVQDFGTGGTPSSPVITIIPDSTITLTSTWTKYSFQFTPPSTAGKTKGTNGDDNAALLLAPPQTVVGNFQITNWELKIGGFAGTYDYRSYEQERGVAFSQRLPFAVAPGDVNKSLIVGTEVTAGQTEAAYVLNNNAGVIELFAGVNALPSDAIMCNGATLDASANNNKYMNLYLSIMNQWGLGTDAILGNVSGDGLSVIATNNAPGAITDAEDYNAGMTVSTIKTGKDGYFQNMFQWEFPLVFGGNGARTSSNTIWVECFTNGSVTDPYDVNTGFTISTTMQGGANSKAIIAIQTTDGGVIGLSGSHFIIYDENGTMFAPWIKVDGSGAAPTVPGATLIEVDVASTDSAEDVAFNLALALGGNQVTKIDAIAGSAVIPGSYLLINGASHEWYLAFTVDGVGIDPAPVGKEKMAIVNVLSTDSAEQVAIKISAMVGAPSFKVPFLNNGQFTRGGPVVNSSIDPDNAARAGGNTLGSLQPWQTQPHIHSITWPTPQYANEDVSGPIMVQAGAVSIINYSTFPATTNSTGQGSQTNPYNVYVNYIIRY